MPHHTPDPLASDAASTVSVKFDSLLLVCGDCEKRSSGPTRLTAKQVRKDLKHQLAPTPYRFRVVQSSCLGLCPKRAIAVAAMPAGGRMLAAELKSEAELARFASVIMKSV